MLSDNEISNIVGFLSNAMDRESHEEMANFLKEEFGLSNEKANLLVTKFVKQYQLDPLVSEPEAKEFVEKIICDSY